MIRKGITKKKIFVGKVLQKKGLLILISLINIKQLGLYNNQVYIITRPIDVFHKGALGVFKLL